MTKISYFKNVITCESLKNMFLINNILYLKTGFGIKKIHMPNYFFFKSNNNVMNNLFLIFDNYQKYNMVFRQLIDIIHNSGKIFLFKLKLRGLGYKIYSYLKRRLIKFFFAYNHFFYLHVPKNVFFKKLKRKFIFFSNNLALLNDIFVKILNLKKMDFYERANTFIVPKKILYIKKRK